MAFSRELYAPDVVNSSRLWLTSKTPSHEPMALDATNS